MSAALLQDANKQHTIADDLESALHVLTWTTLCHVPHKMMPALLTNHLRKVYDEYNTFTGTGGMVKGAFIAAGHYVPRGLELKKPSPLLDLLKTMSDPFVAVYGSKPDQIMKYMEMEDQEDLKKSYDKYDRRLGRLTSPQWFLDTIQAALNDTLWPLDDGSLALPDPVQLGKRPRSPSVPASNEVKFSKHHS